MHEQVGDGYDGTIKITLSVGIMRFSQKNSSVQFYIFKPLIIRLLVKIKRKSPDC